MGNNPSYFSPNGDGSGTLQAGEDAGTLPVENMSYDEALAFCKKLASLDQPALGTYRLPTEAEWEYAARGGPGGAAVVSESQLPQAAWYKPNSDYRAHPVASKTPNALGLYDMLGNVAEWCSDWYDESFYAQADRNGHDPQGAKEAFVAIFIDGLNILGKKPEHPGNCRYWHLDPDSKGEFGGWFSGEAGKYTEEEFRISRATDSEAGKQGYIKSLGQITAVFYTVGSPLPPPPKPAPVYHGETTGAMGPVMGSMAPGAGEDIGTEAGTGREVRLEEQPHDQPGLILAAISLFYRTPSRIEELKQSHHPQQ